MDQKIIDTLAAANVTVASQVMDNGESRHRMMTDGGNQGYILTVAGKDGAWQNAHSHGGAREFYAVVQGWMAFADLVDGVRRMRVVTPDDGPVCSEPGEAHNVYLPAGAAIHTVKWGTAVGNPEKNGADWYPAPEDFDAWTKAQSEEDIRALCAKPIN